MQTKPKTRSQKMTQLNISEIKDYLKLQNKLRNQLGKANEYYHLPYEDMYFINRLMSKQQSDKFMEGWVAHQVGGKKIDRRTIPFEYQNNDLGDIQIGDTLTPNKNNIELKYSFDPKPGIGGGQLRLYEPVSFYLFFKGWDAKKYEMFLLSKDQLINEIEDRALSSGLSAFTSSQRSGIFENMNNQQKLKLLKEDMLTNKRQDPIGWGFNTKTEADYYDRFKGKYAVNFSDVKGIVDAV